MILGRRAQEDGSYLDTFDALVRRVLLILLVVGGPTIVVMLLVLGPDEPVVRWGYPLLALALVVYAVVLLRRPARVVGLSRVTLAVLEAAWVAGMAVQVATATDVDVAWADLSPTFFMVVVIFVVLGFLFFGPRGALWNAGAVAAAVLGAGLWALLGVDGGSRHVADLVRFCVALVVVALFLHVLARAQGRLAVAMIAAERATQEALQMRDMAYLDPLTGIANRRRLVEELSFQAARTGPGTPVAVVYLDLDRFKAINDEHGHAVGDEVLCEVAAVASRQVRQGDLVGRLGGEEFVVVAPGATYERALALAERLRVALRAEVGVGRGLLVTASFGVTMLRPRETASAVLDRVDGLMYEAKAAGRDQVAGVGE